MKCSVAVLVVLSILASSQAVLLSKRLPDSTGLLRTVKIKVQPKELVDECTDCQPIPSAKDLRTPVLKKLIGSMDSGIVSISKPKDFDDEKVLKYSTDRQAKQRRQYLKRLVARSSKRMVKVGPLTDKQETRLVNWLEEQSNCPLRLQWRDMGPYSWPRYVKRAFCVGKPCSVDPGMECTASARRFFPLLRWYCLDASHKNNLPPWIGSHFVERDGYICRWVKYLHPITTQCSCQCKA